MKTENEGWVLTEYDDLDVFSNDSNSILHLQGVGTSVIDGGVRHGEFRELASALDLHTVSNFHFVVAKVPRADRRRPSNDGKVQLQGLASQDVDNLLRNTGEVHHRHHWRTYREIM